jgi:hypothetical protein
MTRFNEICIKFILLLFICLLYGFYVIGAGPTAFASGPLPIALFLLLGLAFLIVIINIGYHIIKGVKHEVQ